MQSKRSGKSASERTHFRLRLYDRYGLYVDNAGVEKLVRIIQTSHLQPLYKKSIRTTVFLMEIEGQPVKVVYDKKRKELITAIPISNIERNRWNEEHKTDDSTGRTVEKNRSV